MYNYYGDIGVKPVKFCSPILFMNLRDKSKIVCAQQVIPCSYTHPPSPSLLHSPGIAAVGDGFGLGPGGQLGFLKPLDPTTVLLQPDLTYQLER